MLQGLSIRDMRCGKWQRHAQDTRVIVGWYLVSFTQIHQSCLFYCHLLYLYHTSSPHARPPSSTHLGSIHTYCALAQQVRPIAREGHAAASWGAEGMILFGGWGGGIRNDIWVLNPVASVAEEEEDEGDGSRSERRFAWMPLKVEGKPPAIR